MADKFWTGATDGDYGTAGNWSPSGVPVASDKVYITGSVNIDADDQSAVELDEFHVMPEYTGTIGTLDGFLQIDLELAAGKFSFAGQGVAHIDLGSADMPEAIIWNTAKVAKGAGLYLTGTGISTLDLRKGDVTLFGATVTTVIQSFISSQSGDTVLVIDSDSTITTLSKSGGDCTIVGASTTLTNNGGTLTKEGSDAITNLNCGGGTIYYNSSGTATNVVIDGGVVDTRKSLEGATFTNTTLNRGTFYEGDNITLTNQIAGKTIKHEAVDG